MEIFAHRGLLTEYPENSFPALTKSFERGFGIETDLRLTKDNDFVVIHDDTFERLAGVPKKVSDCTFAEAEAITYLKDIPMRATSTLHYEKSIEHIISLRRLLEWMRARPSPAWAAIQLKGDCQTEQRLQVMARYFREFEMYDQAFAFDMTKDAATRLKEIAPKIKIGLIVSEFKFEPTIHLWDEVKDFKPMDIVWAAEYRALYSQEFIREVKATGRVCYVVSPDVHTALGHPLAFSGYEATWDNLIAWGSDGICTDFPQQLALRLARG